MGVSNELLILDLIKDLGNSIKSQTGTLAKLEANQLSQKEKLDEVAKTIKEIQHTDIKQSEDIAYQKNKIDFLYNVIEKKQDKVIPVLDSKGEVIAKYDYKKFVWGKLAAVITASGSALIAVLELLGITNIL